MLTMPWPRINSRRHAFFFLIQCHQRGSVLLSPTKTWLFHICPIGALCESSSAFLHSSSTTVFPVDKNNSMCYIYEDNSVQTGFSKLKCGNWFAEHLSQPVYLISQLTHLALVDGDGPGQFKWQLLSTEVDPTTRLKHPALGLQHFCGATHEMYTWESWWSNKWRSDSSWF